MVTHISLAADCKDKVGFATIHGVAFMMMETNDTEAISTRDIPISDWNISCHGQNSTTAITGWWYSR